MSFINTGTVEAARIELALADAAKRRAESAHQFAGRLPNAPTGTITLAWYGFLERMRRANPADVAGIAGEAEDVMRAFGNLTPRQLGDIRAVEGGQTAGFGEFAANIVAAAELAWAANPVLAAWHAARQEAREARATDQAAATERQRVQAEKDAPRRVLASLRAAGFDVQLRRNRITLPPGQAAQLSAHDGAAVREHRAGIAAILLAEIKAAAPVVIA